VCPRAGNQRHVQRLALLMVCISESPLCHGHVAK
jgi:hypothetical protein